MSWVYDEECDREMSRHVRIFIQHNIYPQLSVKPEELPKACALHPDNYIYADQESHKHEESRMDWKCSHCGKHFKTEFYLDKHMHNAHPDLLREGAGNMCPASLCPIFGCRGSDSLGGRGKSKIQKRSTTAGKVSTKKLVDEKNFDLDGICTDAGVERSQYQCEVLVRRCFGKMEYELEHFQQQLCNTLHCADGILKGSIYEYEQRVGSGRSKGKSGSSSTAAAAYNLGSGSNEPHSAYHKDESSFLKKFFLLLILLLLFGYLAMYIFCGHAMGRDKKEALFWKGGVKSSAAKGVKGEYRTKQSNAGPLQFLTGSNRKRHDS